MGGAAADVIDARLVKELGGRGHLAGVHRADAGVHMVVVDQLGGDLLGFFRGALGIRAHQFDLLAVQAAVGVDVVHAQLDAVEALDAIGRVAAGQAEIPAELEGVALRQGHRAHSEEGQGKSERQDLLHVVLPLLFFGKRRFGRSFRPQRNRRRAQNLRVLGA